MFCLKETQDLLANNYVPGQTEPLYMILYVHKELTDALEIAYIGNQFVSNCKDQTRLSRFGRFKSQVSSWYGKDHIWTFIVVNIC